jgi:hypothetical protein
VKSPGSYWPVAVYLISSVAHTDAAIAVRPVIQRQLHISLTTFLVTVAIFSTLQLLFEYWFYGWCRIVAINDVWAWLKNGFWTMCCKRGLDQPLRQIGALLGRLKQAWELFKSLWPQRTKRIVKVGGYSSMFIMSLSPIPGIRGPVVAVCGVERMRWGLVLVILGNLIRNVYLILGSSWLLG